MNNNISFKNRGGLVKPINNQRVFNRNNEYTQRQNRDKIPSGYKVIGGANNKNVINTIRGDDYFHKPNAIGDEEIIPNDAQNLIKGQNDLVNDNKINNNDVEKTSRFFNK